MPNENWDYYKVICQECGSNHTQTNYSKDPVSVFCWDCEGRRTRQRLIELAVDQAWERFKP